MSPFRIDLSWRDNSDEEEGFRVQRRVEGSSQWVDIGATAADLTTYSDTGLEPATTYRYRARAYRNLVASAFSNQAVATTPRVMPPTLTRFSPTSGPVGVQVTIIGTHFHGATAVAFNGVAAARFEVVSGTRIEAVVPWEAASGPIRVVAPGGAVTSAESFTVTDSGIGSRLFVPIVLPVSGTDTGIVLHFRADPHQPGNHDGRHPLHLCGVLRRGLGQGRGCPGPRPATGHSRRHRLPD